VAGGVAALGCQRPEPGPSPPSACDRRRSSLRALRGALGGGASGLSADGRRWQARASTWVRMASRRSTTMCRESVHVTQPTIRKRRFTTWSGHGRLGHPHREDGEVAHRRSAVVPAFDDAARTCVLQWRFSPAQTDGKPIAIVAALRSSFSFLVVARCVKYAIPPSTKRSETTTSHRRR